MVPIVRFQAPLDPHGRNITIGTSKQAVTCWGERVGKPCFRQKAGCFAQDALSCCVVNVIAGWLRRSLGHFRIVSYHHRAGVLLPQDLLTGGITRKTLLVV